MTRLLLALLLIAGPLHAQSPVHAQSPELLSEALKFARAELTQQHVGHDEQVVFNAWVVHRPSVFEPSTDVPVRELWSREHLEMVRSTTNMTVDTLASVAKCTTLPSGRRSCTLRPVRALVSATKPQVSGETATILVFLSFHPREPPRFPHSGEPFDLLYSHTIQIELTLQGDQWTVTGHTKGPPGVTVVG